ncbi:Long-chain fatty alcohol dehydrogenase family protein [Prunus dulcis]|uniref:Long-chain fatty alcohol dehydrogenase family protein n=1 Tax=Prunus dulcis TaxID=3755 RepID=A0A4Y1R5W9_PRUDU|nr:Long-chain fatty alcohol dehydrogenase family protein [Prunus dulcis]
MGEAWRNALAKAMAKWFYTYRNDYASTNVVWCYWAREKSFNHTHCWEVVKTCKRFQIIPTGPTVVLNETPIHETPASDSPMDSPMSQDSPIEKEPRPIGRKAAKAKRGSNASKNASKFLEELSKHQAMRIEMDLKQQEHDMAIQLEYAKEREYVRKEREYVREQNIEKKDRETMAMDTCHMSLKQNNFGS